MSVASGTLANVRLLGPAEERFVPRYEKTNILVSELVRHKPDMKQVSAFISIGTSSESNLYNIEIYDKYVLYICNYHITYKIDKFLLA